MSPALQPMAVQYYCHVSSSVSRDQYTALRSGDVIRTIPTICDYFSNYIYKKGKCKIKKCNRSKPQILSLLWDIVVFRLVAYLLNMICLMLQLLY